MGGKRCQWVRQRCEGANEWGIRRKPSFISKNQLLTIFYIGLWYLFNVQFNIANKSLYKQFPFPWFVSCVHLAVGILVMGFCWGTRVVEWQTPSKQQYKDLVMPGFLHAFGHCLTNVSFAAVAVSFTHTVKTLEPLCSAAGMYLVNGIAYPWPVYASLVPVMLGVAIASTSELSFNWLGFLTAMGSNISFAGRAITSKPLMSNLSSINVYNWVALIALVFCIPPTIYFEGSQLPGAIKQACSSMGTGIFLRRLLEVGFFYHMYNQVAYQALGKVEPVTHAVANVGKRIFVIGFSILAFGNPITAQTAIGSSIAIFGAFAYSYLKVSRPSRHAFLEY